MGANTLQNNCRRREAADGNRSLRPRRAAQSSRVRFWWTFQSAQRLGEMPRNVCDVDRHASFQALEW